MLGSLLRHLDACKKAWEKAESTKAVDKRRPAPFWPDLALPHEPGPALDAWNAAVVKGRSVHECPGCTRTFERLRARKEHVRRCCPDPGWHTELGGRHSSKKPRTHHERRTTSRRESRRSRDRSDARDDRSVGRLSQR